MYGVTAKGFKAKRFDDLYNEMAETLGVELGLTLAPNADTVINALTNVYLLPVAQLWASQEAQQGMFDVKSAEGKHLDDLVSWVNISRRAGAATAGYIYITTNEALVIPEDEEFSDNNGNIFHNRQAITVDLTQCTEADLVLAANQAEGSLISLTINGVTYNKTLGVDNLSSVFDFITELNTAQELFTASSYTVDSEYFIRVVAVNQIETLTIAHSSNLSVHLLQGFGRIYYEETGSNDFSANTIINGPFFSSIEAVTNKEIFTGGYPEESDHDLRTRHAISRFKAGSATLKAIRSSLLGLAGVVDVLVIENETNTTNDLGLPMKSLRCIVKGGNEKEIAEALYQEKGAGIELSGDVAVSIINSQETPQVVLFSRPEPLYVHMRIQYTLFESEDFPVDGEAAILAAAIEYGEDLSTGEDLLPQRLESYIINTVVGLETVEVTLGTTTVLDEPTPYLALIPVEVSSTQESFYDASRISINEREDNWVSGDQWVDAEDWTDLEL